MVKREESEKAATHVGRTSKMFHNEREKWSEDQSKGEMEKTETVCRWREETGKAWLDTLREGGYQWRVWVPLVEFRIIQNYEKPSLYLTQRRTKKWTCREQESGPNGFPVTPEAMTTGHPLYINSLSLG